MAMVSGRGSTLNPNARPFIPAVYRQVEDFSSERWNLVENSAWYRDYWMSEHQDTSFEGLEDPKDDDITNLLPDTFDVGYDEFLGVDAEFEEMVHSYDPHDPSGLRTAMKPQIGISGKMSGAGHAPHDAAALMANLSLLSPQKGLGLGQGTSSMSMVEPARYNERHMQYMSPKHGPRRIHQPR